MGEGGAVLVLEELEHARARGAHVYCEIGGLRHLRQRLPHDRADQRGPGDGPGDRRTRSTTPGSTPTTIDYVNAHGSGTKQNDRHETAAVKRSLGAHAYDTPDELDQVDGRATRWARSARSNSSPASWRWTHQVVPPTANYETPDPECDLDYVPRVARERKLRSVLSVGSGFGGFQSAVVMNRPREKTR